MERHRGCGDVVDHPHVAPCHCNLTPCLLSGVQLVWVFVVHNCFIIEYSRFRVSSQVHPLHTAFVHVMTVPEQQVSLAIYTNPMIDCGVNVQTEQESLK